MFTQYFGNYLFESKIITLEQFTDALQKIGTRRAKLGVLAIEEGLMTPLQVENIHALQMQVDKKFGELAVENGYFTNEQLEELLSKQSSPFSVFSQIMFDEGYMTYVQISENIDGYRRKCGMTEESFTRFKNGDIEPLIEKIVFNSMNDDNKKLIVVSYVEVFIKNVMRFLSDNIILGEIERVTSVNGDWVSCQKMTGSQEIITSFAGSEKAMLYFSSEFSKKEFNELDAMARDILGEFLNCSNGIFVANIIENGLDLDLEPQYVTEDKTMAQTNDMLSIPFSIENNSYQLYLAF